MPLRRCDYKARGAATPRARCHHGSCSLWSRCRRTGAASRGGTAQCGGGDSQSSMPLKMQPRARLPAPPRCYSLLQRQDNAQHSAEVRAPRCATRRRRPRQGRRGRQRHCSRHAFSLRTSGFVTASNLTYEPYSPRPQEVAPPQPSFSHSHPSGLAKTYVVRAPLAFSSSSRRRRHQSSLPPTPPPPPAFYATCRRTSRQTLPHRSLPLRPPSAGVRHRPRASSV